jgi:hypothetical protein
VNKSVPVDIQVKIEAVIKFGFWFQIKAEGEIQPGGIHHYFRGLK